MTAPTPKPEERHARARRYRLRIPQPVALAGSACMAFAVFALALIRVLPSPHAKSDYLIIGTLATLAALITIFAGLVMGRRKR